MRRSGDQALRKDFQASDPAHEAPRKPADAGQSRQRRRQRGSRQAPAEVRRRRAEIQAEQGKIEQRQFKRGYQQHHPQEFLKERATHVKPLQS